MDKQIEANLEWLERLIREDRERLLKVASRQDNMEERLEQLESGSPPATSPPPPCPTCGQSLSAPSSPDTAPRTARPNSKRTSRG